MKDYWEGRWSSIPADDAMENPEVYPLKYTEQTIRSGEGKILEAGCGAGRVLRYYHNKGYNIIGIDFIGNAVKKLKQTDPQLHVEVGDITKLPYRDRSFRYILAFGLYHNLEKGVEQAVQETYRVLESEGKVCASFRADNIHTYLIDWLANYRKKGSDDRDQADLFFHKMNLKRAEFVKLFEQAGFQVEAVYPVENMPILYKFSLFRAKHHKTFNESLGRKEGYRLSLIGKMIQRSLFSLFPDQVCNIYVVIAKRPGK